MLTMSHVLLFFSDWISFFIAVFHLSHRGDFTACLYVVGSTMLSIEIAAYAYETCALNLSTTEQLQRL